MAGLRIVLYNRFVMPDITKPHALAAVGGLLLVLLVPATSGQEENFREREVLDPVTDTWVRETVPAEIALSGPLAEARGLLAEGKVRKARRQLNGWLDDYPDDDAYFEGVFLLGECYFRLGDFWRAAEQYEAVAENTAGTLFRRANERVVDVARAFLAGKKRILWRVFRIPAYDDGLELLDRVWEREPGSRLGEFALWTKAEYHRRRGDVDLAQDEYAFLVEEYPAGRYVQLAMLRSAETAEAAFPGVRHDERPLLNAAERYRQINDVFPPFAEREGVPQRIEGIRQQRAQKDLEVARWYERTRRPEAAIFYYRLVVNDWSQTVAAAEAEGHLQELGLTVAGPSDSEDEPQ